MDNKNPAGKNDKSKNKKIVSKEINNISDISIATSQALQSSAPSQPQPQQTAEKAITTNPLKSAQEVLEVVDCPQKDGKYVAEIAGRKLTAKQTRVLKVLADYKHAKLNQVQKAEKAGVSLAYLSWLLRDVEFVKVLRLQGLSEILSGGVNVIQRMKEDALNGKYMQQRTLLEMAGFIATPTTQQYNGGIVNVLINNSSVSSDDDVDKQIMRRILASSGRSDASIDNTQPNGVIDVTQ